METIPLSAERRTGRFTPAESSSISQQGIALSTAFKKTPEPVGDLWLTIAELAEQAVGKTKDVSFPERRGAILGTEHLIGTTGALRRA